MAMIKCPLCGKSISDRSPTCPFCSEQGRANGKSGLKLNAKTKSSGSRQTTILIVCLFAVLTAYFVSQYTIHRPAENIVQEEQNPTPDMAYLASQKYVTERLKSPASAIFPTYPEYALFADNGNFSVRAYVDSQNGFGALIRTYYRCELSWSPSRYWQLETIEFLQ